MDLQLAGKPVVVTGGAGGIGAAISLSLAREGAVPVILDRAAPPPALMAELQRLAPRTLALQLDLVDEAACVAAVRRVLATVGLTETFLFLLYAIGVGLATWMARGTTRRLYDLMRVTAATSRGFR